MIARAGFTLVEIMIGVAIIALFAVDGPANLCGPLRSLQWQPSTSSYSAQIFRRRQRGPRIPRMARMQSALIRVIRVFRGPTHSFNWFDHGFHGFHGCTDSESPNRNAHA